jgi:hypothetical protein
MRKPTKKPLQLTTHTVKALDQDALVRAGGGLNYNGSVNAACWLSGLTICSTCYPA